MFRDDCLRCSFIFEKKKEEEEEAE